MHTAATTRMATLSGQSAMPFSVSGVTTAPISMPSSTNASRASARGMTTGLPNTAATATASIEPEISPAGKPADAKTSAPSAANANVSAQRNKIFDGGADNGMGHRHAARCRCRQMRRSTGEKKRRTFGAASSLEENAREEVSVASNPRELLGHSARHNQDLERDDFSCACHPALGYWWSMVFSENRGPLSGSCCRSKTTMKEIRCVP